MKTEENVTLDFDVTKTNSDTGLNSDQVLRSEQKFGKNVLSGKKVKTTTLILKEFKQPILILLIIAMLATFAIAIESAVTGKGSNKLELIPMFVEPCFILGIIIFSIAFTIMQEQKIEKAMIMIKKLTATETVVIRNSKKEIINSFDLVVGDIIEVSANQIVGADCQLLTSDNLRVNETILLGREVINLKDHNFKAQDSNSIESRADWIFKGTKVESGYGLAIVRSIGNDTQIGILHQALKTEESHSLSPLQKQIDKLSKILGGIAGSVCVIFFFLDILASSHYKGMDFSGNNTVNAISISISLAIAAIPEGLLAIVTVLLTACVKKMSFRYILVKKIPYVELLGFANTITLEDKGVIDSEHKPIARIKSFIKEDEKREHDADKLTYKLLAGLSLSPNLVSINTNQIKYFLRNHQLNLSDLVNDYQLINNWSNQQSSLVLLQNTSTNQFLAIKIAEITSTEDKHLHFEIKHKPILSDHLRHMSEDGLDKRIIEYRMFDSLPNDLNLNNVKDFNLAALVGITNIKECLKILKESHLHPLVLTQTSLEELKQDTNYLDLISDEKQVCSSSLLRQWDDSNLYDNIKNYSIFVDLDRDDKERIATVLKTKSNVCSVGGYESDESIFTKVNVACAFTRISTTTASDNAKIIMSNNSLSSVISGIRLSRTVLANIKATLTMLLTANIACLLTTFLGILIFMTQPMGSLQLLTINILAETAVGFPMANNARKEKVMGFRPLKETAFIIDKNMALKIFIMGFLATGLSLLMFYVGSASFYGFDYNLMIHSEAALNSAHHSKGIAESIPELAINAGSSLSFMTLAMMLLINGLCYRTSGSMFTDSINDSKRMLIVVLVSLGIVFAFNYIPHLNTVFQCGPYNFIKQWSWLNVLPYLAVILNVIIHEVWKIADNKIMHKKLNTSKIESVIKNAK